MIPESKIPNENNNLIKIENFRPRIIIIGSNSNDKMSKFGLSLISFFPMIF